MGSRLATVAAALGVVSLAGATTATSTAEAESATTTSANADTTTSAAESAATTSTTEAPTTTTTGAPGLTLTASASEGAPGTVVRLSGSGCLVDGGQAEWVDVGLLRMSPDDGRYYSYSQSPAAPPDGVFDIELTIPPEAFRGGYDLLVACGYSDMILASGSVPFTVTEDPATLPSLTVWPLSVRPGAEIGLAGEHCTVFGRPGEKMSVQVFIGGEFPIGPDGSWSGLLTVPADVPLGTYVVNAYCHADRSYYNTPDAQITVEGEAVTPSTTAAPLPRTGGSAGNATATGAITLLAGLALLAATRRVPRIHRM